jgi:UDP-2,3-diacylglucosamine hydrolase
MQISSISDVHIKELGDPAYKLIEKFFNHESVRSSDLIILNGDIFDILIGGKSQYLEKYVSFFEEVKKLTLMGVKVVYIEGNHDFHVSKVIDKSIKKFDISKDLFIHVKNKYEVNIGSKKILFTHGDDVEIENDKYKSYKKKINNPFVKFLGDYIVPFSLIEWIGHRASNKSRGKNEKKYELTPEGQKFVKEKFRKSADIFFKNESDISYLVCGHSHCKDIYSTDSHQIYINNGYALKSNSFIYIDSNGPQFIDL